MKLKQAFSRCGLALVLILAFAAYSTATTTASAARTTTVHTAVVHQAQKASVKESSAWNRIEGKVVKADINANTLVLASHGKDTKFSVPGRIDMLNLKPGDKVTAQYIAEGKTLRLWQLKAQ